MGYNPGMQNWFAPGGGGGSFQDRFGMGFPGAGTPSQYTASPYTDVQGQTYPPNVPQGFQTQFNAFNPGGALNPGQLPSMMDAGTGTIIPGSPGGAYNYPGS
jgi:hypothetical protein